MSNCPLCRDLVSSVTEVEMKTYVAIIGERSILAFRAESEDEARALIDDEGGGTRSDLKVLDGTDG
jgi:hypothetical protein